jgi:hypothetical protein
MKGFKTIMMGITLFAFLMIIPESIPAQTIGADRSSVEVADKNWKWRHGHHWNWRGDGARVYFNRPYYYRSYPYYRSYYYYNDPYYYPYNNYYYPRSGFYFRIGG